MNANNNYLKYIDPILKIMDSNQYNCENKSILCDHSNCLISSLRGLRNGIYYGAKVRFLHSLVMTILFKPGNFMKNFEKILKMTWEHAKNLGIFVFIYKSTVCLLKKLVQYILKNKKINPTVLNIVMKFIYFISGIIGSYFVWADMTAINMQIMLYLLSRNLLAIGSILKKKYYPNSKLGFSFMSMLVWGVVMMLFESRPGDLQKSLMDSMVFIYKDSDSIKNGWRDYVPFYIP